MSEIIVSNIYKSFGSHDVLRGLTLEINKGYIYGIVGNNGSGKSTLFNIITGKIKEDSGNIFLKNGLRVGYLEQFLHTNKESKVKDVLNQAFSEIMQTEEKMRLLEEKMTAISEESEENDRLLRKYSDLQVIYDSLGGSTVNERIKKVSKGLKISDEMQESLFETLSGGERTRVHLARLLLSENDILLLDEPTNHLDIDSAEWLEKFIAAYDGTVVIISHDRYFLDKCTDYTVEISGGKAKVYKGNYSFYSLEREKEIERLSELYERQQREIKRLSERARQLRDWANDVRTNKKALAMERRIERIEKIDRPRENKKINISVSSSAFRGKELIKAEKMCFSYNGLKNIFEESNLDIYNGENVGLLGPNGCGKTTFLKILLGEIQLNSGKIKMGNSVKYAYLPQNVVFEDVQKTILEYIQSDLDIKTGEARNLLAKYNFMGEDVFKEIGALSGGEKSRLRLCCLLHKKINLLILDEPTNHLDIGSREVLEEMLGEFEGAIFFVSHDRYFIRRFANCIVDIADGKLIKYGMNYEVYREEKELKTAIQEESLKKEHGKRELHKSEEDRLYEERKRSEKRASDPWRIKKIAEIEDMISEKEEILSKIDEKLFSDGIKYEEIIALSSEKEKINKEIEELLAKWEGYSS